MHGIDATSLTPLNQLLHGADPLLRNLDRFAGLGCAILIGTSRKRFLGTLTGRDVSERATASVASALAALVAGADIVRVHDVGPMVDALKVWTAQVGWSGPRCSSIT